LADIVPELNELRDARARVKLSDTNLPSICCYTFHNAGDYINCLRASDNAEFIAAGFSDSLVKLWSVTSARPDLPSPSPTKLVGHSGPVYGLDFSSCGNYLISSSEDKTGKVGV
jgi:transcription initiation factor TFIID subunit 5